MPTATITAIITTRMRARWNTTTASTTRASSVAELGGPATFEVSEALLPAAALQKLMTWLSPSFPVGGYTYSHGLEWAIDDGSVTSPDALAAWLAAILAHGAGRSDAIVFCHAWRARGAALREVAGLAAAFQPSRERHLESTAQGNAFMAAVRAAWPKPELDEAAAALAGLALPYPVAVAAAAAFWTSRQAASPTGAPLNATEKK